MSFWARIFNSECPTCEVLKEQLRLERERAQACPTCDTLKVQIGIEQAKLREFTNHILHPTMPVVETNENMPQPILPKHVPWNIQQQKLEVKDKREHARLLEEQQVKTSELTEEKKKEISALEEELGVSNG